MGRLPRRTEAILADFLENVLLPSRRPRLASNRCGPNSVRPNHLSGHNFDHDYIYESVGPVNRKMGRLPRRTEAILADFLENVLLPSRRPRLASNRCGPNSVRPNHLSGHNFDHDYNFELPPEWRGSGAPHQVNGDLLHTMDVYGLPRVRTELLQLLVIPSSAPHPSMKASGLSIVKWADFRAERKPFLLTS